MPPGLCLYYIPCQDSSNFVHICLEHTSVIIKISWFSSSLELLIPSGILYMLKTFTSHIYALFRRLSP